MWDPAPKPVWKRLLQSIKQLQVFSWHPQGKTIPAYNINIYSFYRKGTKNYLSTNLTCIPCVLAKYTICEPEETAKNFIVSTG
jgi:hypothetical protein